MNKPSDLVSVPREALEEVVTELRDATKSMASEFSGSTEEFSQWVAGIEKLIDALGVDGL